MKDLCWRIVLGALGLFLIVGCKPAVPPGGGVDPEASGRGDPAEMASVAYQAEIASVAYRISEPLVHKNMTVFVLSLDEQDERDFLTLDEGLKADLVSITELQHESVGTLQIENRSDRPLYLQEGERLQGGKQDRVIASSLAVPPYSGRQTVPTFCVEHSRWVEGDQGRTFGFTVNPALAPKGVRGAAKVEANQGNVWTCVGAQKVSGNTILKTANTNSSVNELLDAPESRSVSNDYALALAGAADSLVHSKAVGVVIALNNQIEEVDIYPNSALFRKLYPRLIQSYAIQAALLDNKADGSGPLVPETVARFLKPGRQKSMREKSIDEHNKMRVFEGVDDTFWCETRYDGKVIHWQTMKQNGAGDSARCASLGSRW